MVLFSKHETHLPLKFFISLQDMSYECKLFLITTFQKIIWGPNYFNQHQEFISYALLSLGFKIGPCTRLLSRGELLLIPLNLFKVNKRVYMDMDLILMPDFKLWPPT